MKQTLEYSPDLSAFTYLKDREGFIYYSSGDNSLENDAIRSVLVYAPVPDSRATRYQANSDTGYIKSVSHGYQSELPRMQEELSPGAFEKIRSMFVQDNETGDEFLALPTSRIAEVYDPKSSLSDLLAGRVSGYSLTAIDKLHAGIEKFTTRGISLGRLGLYGGLQCHLTHAGGKEINDIDLLVDGLDAYSHVVELAHGNLVRPETFPHFVASNGIKRAVAIRRGQLSQFRLGDYPDTVVDIRLLRTHQDEVNTAALASNAQSRRHITFKDVEVVGAAESLSVPARYEIKDVDGESWSVVTNQYHHLGAAGIGNQVSVCGDAIEGNVIVLTDPDRHHIYDPAIL